MSVHLAVFVPRRLPSQEDWVQSASLAGFDLVFEEPIDLLLDRGGQRLICGGVPAGFEVYLDGVGDYLDEVGDDLSWIERLRIRRFAYAVDFVTHSSFDDLFAATVAAGALTHAARGVLLDTRGRFVPYRAALAWARREARPPSSNELAHRDRVRRGVQEFVGEILPRFGYELLDWAPDGDDRPQVKWYARTGRVYRNELVEIDVGGDRAESFLSVSFWATPYSLGRLQTKGLERNVVGYNLSQLHSDEAFRELDPPLSQSIAVDEGFPQSESARKLERELRAADSAVFERLRELEVEAGHVWPDES